MLQTLTNFVNVFKIAEEVETSIFFENQGCFYGFLVYNDDEYYGSDEWIKKTAEEIVKNQDYYLATSPEFIEEMGKEGEIEFITAFFVK